MITTSARFTELSKGNIRPLSWQVSISFDKAFNSSINFFTIGVSTIGSGDFIPGTGSVVQEWDKYLYTDYSSRVLQIEWTRQTDLFASINLAMADVTFDNHDDFFTPSGDSIIAPYILPYRPIRIWAGFGGEVIPVFVGITESMPTIDEKTKTATFHCVDFLYSLMGHALKETSLYQSQTTDVVLRSLFIDAGLTSSQLNLDVGLETIGFGAFNKDSKLADALNDLMIAEQGRLFMDEQGIITFKNRTDYNNNVVMTFDAYNNINDSTTKTADDIINVVEVTGTIRSVAPKQRFWKLTQSIAIPANQSYSFFADFSDPVTSVDLPVYRDIAATSYYKGNTASDDSGSNTGAITLVDTDLFAQSYKMTFYNSSSVTLYLTEVILYATPAFKVQSIYVREEDEESSAIYDERIYTINSDLFQSSTAAQSRALSILQDWSSFRGISTLDVKGNMALQIDDVVSVDIFGNSGIYRITKILNKISSPAKYLQLIVLRKFYSGEFFTIAVSLIGGEDAIRP